MDTRTKTINEIPLVSVLMLSYNRAQYLPQAIDSVLSQTYRNFELIIIDDGSTDNTQDVLLGYDEPRIRVVRHDDNHGLHASRAESLQQVRGAYVAVLDSDDVWLSPYKLERQVDYLEQHIECVVVGTFLTIIDQNGQVIGSNSYATEDQDIRQTILGRNQFVHSGVVMRHSALTKTVGYRDTVLAEDYDLFLQLGMHGMFANIPEYFTAYRIHDDSFNHQRISMAQAVLGIIRNYRGIYPRYYYSVTKAYLRIWYNQLKRLLMRG